MKKVLRNVALLMVMLMTVSLVAGATGTETHDVSGEKAYLDFESGFKPAETGSSAEFITVTEVGGATSEKVEVTVKNSIFSAEDKYYLILAVTDENDIKQDTIIYIDQVEATTGSVTFTVFPSVMKDSVILITGVNEAGQPNGQVKVAILEGKYVVGDVDGDKDVDADDIVLLARYLVGDVAASEIDQSGANVDQLGEIGADDIVLLARALVGDIKLN